MYGYFEQRCEHYDNFMSDKTYFEFILGTWVGKATICSGLVAQLDAHFRYILR